MKKVKYFGIEELGSTKLSEVVYSVYWDVLKFTKDGGIIDMSTFLTVNRAKKCFACLGGISVMGFLPKLSDAAKYSGGDIRRIDIDTVVQYLDSNKETQLDNMKNFFDAIRSKEQPYNSSIRSISISDNKKSNDVIDLWRDFYQVPFTGFITGEDKTRLTNELLALADMLDAEGC